MKMLVTRILMPLDLNLSKARGVGLFHSGLPTTDLQKMNTYKLPKCKKKTLILKYWDLEPECLSMPRAYRLWESRINSKWGLLSSVLLLKLYSSRETSSPTDSSRYCPCHWLCWLNLSSCCARQLRRCTIQTCWQRKSRTPFSLGCEVAKLDNLRKRYRFARAKNTQWPIEKPYEGQIWWLHWVLV